MAKWIEYNHMLSRLLQCLVRFGAVRCNNMHWNYAKRTHFHHALYARNTLGVILAFYYTMGIAHKWLWFNGYPSVMENITSNVRAIDLFCCIQRYHLQRAAEPDSSDYKGEFYIACATVERIRLRFTNFILLFYKWALKWKFNDDKIEIWEFWRFKLTPEYLLTSNADVILSNATKLLTFSCVQICRKNFGQHSNHSTNSLDESMARHNWPIKKKMWNRHGACEKASGHIRATVNNLVQLKIERTGFCCPQTLYE